MTRLKKQLGVVSIVGLILTISMPASSAPIYSEDFNGYTGTQNATQYETGLNVAHSGNVVGWSKSGAGTMHAVDLGSGNWAIMFYQDNVITLTTGIAANDLGTSYEVKFNYGTAVYDGGTQRTLAGDLLLVEVVRGNDTVLASQTFPTGAWDDNQNLDAGLTGRMPYLGDGTGVVRLQVGPSAGSFNQGRFVGEIDNLSVSVVPVAWSGLHTSDITATSAVAAATVSTNLTNTVLVWDTYDRGTGSTNYWTYSRILGPKSAGSVGGTLTNLVANTRYAWRFYGVTATTNGWSAPSTFGPIFSEHFNGLAGGGSGTQVDTGLGLRSGATLAGWTLAGGGTIHAVNLDGSGNWAPMFFQDNVMTLGAGQDANDSGTTYRVSFDYGTAVYEALSQMTEVTDSLLVEVLRTDDSVLASTNVAAGVWGAGNYNLDAGQSALFDYVGDGIGYVRLRLGPTVDGSGNFEGTIDNLSWALAPLPPPAGTCFFIQ